MTKAEVVAKLAKDAKISKKAAETVLNSFVGCVRDSLKKGKRLSLIGFGTFSVGKRSARIGRNPQTGAVIKIKASKTVRFKAGKALKDAVR
ncbi:MAG: HU family DNA-binding protein [candidate division NC10 bacterium]